VTDQAIFDDVSQTIRIALEKTAAENPGKTKLAESSFKIALAQLV
jgi:hypothetical protein